jgi:phosphoglucomutase
LIPALLAAEMTARTGRDPSQAYRALTDELGKPFSVRVDAKANPEQKALLSKLSPQQVTSTMLAGEPIQSILSHAPGNDQAIGGLKVMTENGWFAARPSGTEDIYKIYAESFVSDDHLKQLVAEAQTLVDGAITAK